MIPRTLLLLALLAAAPSPSRAAAPLDEIEAFLQVPAVAGREEMARDFVRQRLQGLPAEVDKAGNLVLSAGSGSPRRLVACPLGEPGYVVSGIEPDGWLRLFPSGEPSFAPLWDQAHEGHVVTIGGSRGLVPGAVTVRSVHLEQEPPLPGAPPPPPFRISDAWVDVGAESAAEVAEMGIRLLDPVALIRRPVRLAGGLLAGPSARQKGACVAQIEAARSLSHSPGKGTTVFAWTVNDRLNQAALTHLIRTRGPFEEVVQLSGLFGWSGTDKIVPEPLPRPGSGLLGSGQIPASGRASEAPHPPFPLLFGEARVAVLGLPGLYPDSAVETISGEDVDRLTSALVAFAGGRSGELTSAPPLPPPPAFAPTAQGHEEVADLLGRLIAQPGVSGAEVPVREEIRRHLPAWAKPDVDEQGNLLVTFGQGEEHSLFIAHMDEVGFRVTEILPDGRLKLEIRGGLLPYVWEGQAALVHLDHQDGRGGSVPAVFEPREDWRKADRRNVPGPLTVSLGVGSAREAEALGVKVGGTVTMPKRLLRLGRHRGVARAFDDRNGCTALLLALRQIDPAKLRRKVTFAWAVQEEVGLVGSAGIAARIPGITRVHPVDTFVSSDTPRESKRFAHTPLGKGVVLRAMDNASLVPRELLDRFQALAGRSGIPVQYGVTGGASDGVAFLPNGVEMIPFSWPGRSSHSPVEISDLRDVESLIRLIVATATE